MAFANSAPALGRQRQVDPYEYQISQGYIVKLSQKKKKTGRKERKKVGRRRRKVGRREGRREGGANSDPCTKIT